VSVRAATTAPHRLEVQAARGAAVARARQQASDLRDACIRWEAIADEMRLSRNLWRAAAIGAGVVVVVEFFVLV